MLTVTLNADAIYLFDKTNLSWELLGLRSFLKLFLSPLIIYLTGYMIHHCFKDALSSKLILYKMLQSFCEIVLIILKENNLVNFL